MDVKPGEIDIEIGGIALSEIPFGGERRLREAVVRELARVAAQAGGEWQPQSVGPRLHVGHQRPDAVGKSSADAVAARVGRDVHSHLSGSARG